MNEDHHKIIQFQIGLEKALIAKHLKNIALKFSDVSVFDVLGL